MPYIKPEQRTPELDNVIDNLASNIAGLPSNTDEGFVGVAGKLNYSISRLCAQIMDKPSYVKIALITGVLENVKQEFYRRVAAPYEDKKIKENGDLPEYLKHERTITERQEWYSDL